MKQKKANKKWNELSNEKLQALNIGDWVELMAAINYLEQGKWVCEEIKNSMLNQLQGVEAIKLELQGMIASRIPKLWRANNTIVSKFEFMSNLQKVSKDLTDAEAL